MSNILMVKGNTETYVDELLVGEMEEKGFEVLNYEEDEEDEEDEEEEE